MESIFTILPPELVPMVEHYRGLPPEAAGGIGTRELMRSARALLIVRNQDGVFLHRYDVDGVSVGDTWHQSLDDALDQAQYEFPGLAEQWQPIPPEVENAPAFAVERLKAALRCQNWQ